MVLQDAHGMKVKTLSDKANPLEHKIMTKKRFSAAVEHQVDNNNMSYISILPFSTEYACTTIEASITKTITTTHT